MSNGNWATTCKKCNRRHRWKGSQFPIPPCPKCSQAKKPGVTVSHEPIEEVAAAIGQCGDILSSIELIPDAGCEFAESVEEKIRDIAETIERTNRVSECQQNAIDNIQCGVERWIE